MSSLSDYEYLKVMAMIRSNEIDKPGLEHLPCPYRSSTAFIGGLFLKVKDAICKVFRFIADLFREDPSAYNERVLKQRQNPPVIRGLS